MGSTRVFSSRTTLFAARFVWVRQSIIQLRQVERSGEQHDKTERGSPVDQTLITKDLNELSPSTAVLLGGSLSVANALFYLNLII